MSTPRVMRSEYMEWAKTRQAARYTLAVSGIKGMTLAELGASLDDLELVLVRRHRRHVKHAQRRRDRQLVERAGRAHLHAEAIGDAVRPGMRLAFWRMPRSVSPNGECTSRRAIQNSTNSTATL